MEGFDSFVTGLKQAAAADLPGWAAQAKMAPAQRMQPETWAEYYKNARLGAVLILFYPLNDAVHTVLIQRPTYEGVHSAQIAFPGGKKEEDDQDLIQTALREAWEEVGIRPEQVEVIRPLSELYIPPSNFLVTPVLGICYERPAFVPQITEVETILETDLKLLSDPSIAAMRRIFVREGLEVDSPSFDLGGRVIWGATAMMISELNEILKEVRW
jgi:8-oxo-dGTP pyrophosphatase MutT (NUDIX family)